jgi:hypothetical protein
MITEPEEDFINTFVVARKRERYIELLRSPMRRRECLRQLYHFRDFVPDCIVPLAKGRMSADAILAELHRRDAGGACYLISVQPALDGITIQLQDAIARVYRVAEGTILSCVRGRLAYYEGEPPHNRFILHRSGDNTSRRHQPPIPLTKRSRRPPPRSRLHSSPGLTGQHPPVRIIREDNLLMKTR